MVWIILKSRQGNNLIPICSFLLNILLNDSRNQPHCHIPVCINPCNHEADIIFLAGHPVVIAAVGNGVDADVEADEYGALMDIRDRPGVLALNLAFTQVFLAGVAVHAFDVGFHRDVLQGADLHA